MVWWNYRLCVVTEPGHVPSGWRPDANGEGIEVKRGNYAPRYCKMCDHFKPPRAHHCRQCKTCVLKVRRGRDALTPARPPLPVDRQLYTARMAPLTPGVGFFNHGHFIRFLLWVDIATSFHLILMAGKVYEFMKEPWVRHSTPQSLPLVAPGMS